MDRVNILGVQVNVVDNLTLTDRIVGAVGAKRGEVFPYVNINAVNIASKDPRFREILNSTGNAYCDGEGVRLGARILGRELPPRIVLTYYYWELCEAFERAGISIFLLGSRESIVTKAAEETRRRHPGLRVAGCHHGYFHPSESGDVVRLVNESGAEVLFVGFGMPLQEYWIADHLSHLESRAILPCGSMIEYAAGARVQTPPWMADHGLEWLFRLIQEPGRLWSRYLVGNPLFLIRVIRQRIEKGRA